MPFALTAVAASLLFSGALAVIIALLVWRQRPKQGATWLSLTVLSIALCALALGFSWGSSTAGATWFWFDVAVAAITGTSGAWLLFAARYTGRDAWITRGRVAALLLVPVLTFAIAVTNFAELMYVDPGVTEAGALAFEWGPGMVTVVTVTYPLLAVATWYLYEKTLRSRNVYRQRSAFLLVVGVTIWASHAASVAGLSPFPHLTLVPIAFVGVGAASLLVLTDHRFLRFVPVDYVFSLFGSRFEELAPIARDIVIEEMESGVVVLDADDRIVDLNPIAKRILGADGRRLVGRPIAEVIDSDAFVDEEPVFVDDASAEGTFRNVWVETPEGEPRCYDVVVTDLSAKRDDVAGRVGIIHDVTEKQRQQRRLRQQTQELERQNERLEEFASVVSHDLRNPLAVARGHVQVVEDTGELQYLEKVSQAHDRIEAIIDDMLTLAHQGRTLEETEPISLATVARLAWEAVDTHAADLDVAVDEDHTIQADASRLQQVLENLFRNAHEHAGPDVQIHVGTMEDGFYVEDDGDGIPDALRDDVFERGFTTSDDGTGFGLAIVETIVEAHGWEVGVADGRRGGARFEITGTRSAVTDADAVPAYR